MGSINDNRQHDGKERARGSTLISNATSPPSAGWSRGTADTFLCLEESSFPSFPCLSSVCDQHLWASEQVLGVGVD